ncbi:hypothetical protein [Paenarthrobacter sp. 22069]|uniref:hypothetical protein n=1 Tax=Paenarthrobacter sp. 22069 TaxID=3453864 RepID=UPI003F86537B
MQGDRQKITPASDSDYRALFIGDQAENGAFFEELLGQLVDEHLGWRQSLPPCKALCRPQWFGGPELPAQPGSALKGHL